MNVSHGAGNRAGGDIENLGELGSVQVAIRAYLNSWIAALSNQRREPADFQLQSDRDQQISLPQFQQETWLGFDEVGILISLGNGLHRDSVATNLLVQW